MPNLGGYALVMDPTFVRLANNVRFSKVLIDNGSSINIMYRDTMQKLGIKENMLEPMWGPRFTTLGFPICIQFTIP
jgi:hypothetical protein